MENRSNMKADSVPVVTCGLSLIYLFFSDIMELMRIVHVVRFPGVRL